ncbi:MAG: methylmalonyl Co-A mutase-associated GTPase MeaB [Rhodospirillaceae bacterium]
MPAANNRTDKDFIALAERVTAGDRRALAQAITMIESSRADHRGDAASLIRALLPHANKSIRIGITGIPGVGKSTFIESLGMSLIARGHRVAVLAVDPTSPRSGGSILGDKTRMERLAREKDAYIRPTPSGGTLGGVARRTREAIIAVEAQGFDVVFVETVGVGQSETAVRDLVDMFLLLLAPGGGDDLQGIKKGIVEMADLIVVNKADGDLLAAAERAARDYAAALHLLRRVHGDWTPRVLKCSAQQDNGIDDIWRAVEAFRSALAASGRLADERARQAKAWMWSEIRDSLIQQLTHDPRVALQITELEAAVAAGAIEPSEAAGRILRAFSGATNMPPKKS